MQTFTIELRVDYDDTAKNDLIKEACIKASQELFAQAVLIADKRKPQVALHGSDFYQGTEEIPLVDAESQ